MTSAGLKVSYRAMCNMAITIRRYDSSRAWTDYAVTGYIRVFGGKELVGTIVQGDQMVIVLAESLTQAGFAAPVTTFDKVVGTDRERAILAPIVERKTLDGTLIAYELQVRG